MEGFYKLMEKYRITLRKVEQREKGKGDYVEVRGQLYEMIEKFPGDIMRICPGSRWAIQDLVQKVADIENVGLMGKPTSKITIKMDIR